MRDFNSPSYVVTNHLAGRLEERTELSPYQFLNTIHNEGAVVLETKNHRYVRHDDVIYPCVKSDDEKATYVVKTALEKGMKVVDFASAK